MGRWYTVHMRILLIEDEEKLRRNLKLFLVDQKYSVDEAENGEIALEKVIGDEYDCMIMDVGLPDIDGLALCSTIREENITTPILLLTARDTTEDKVKGLDAGADDYLTKPFSLDELLARIRALMRRQSNTRKPLLSSGALSMNPVTHEVLRSDIPIRLSAKEYALLEYLLRHKGEIVSKQNLLEHVWGGEVDPFSKVIDVYIGYLRNKIDTHFANEEPLLITIRGLGYQLKKS